MKSKRQWALHLARKGLRIFPVAPNSKRPAVKDWPRIATSDFNQIDRWWGGEYSGCNIGVATGRGIAVLDCDCKGGRPGLESLALMEDLYDLPKSFQVTTPSGGLHVYFNVPEGETIPCSVNALDGFPGIDVRGEGGFVLGPGSVIDGKMYAERT